ncbi:MAG: SHOCT domain-containing protein [Armatimonas sp.]
MLTNELERLGALHSQGLLTEAEFSQAKVRLLTESVSDRELRQLRWQAELERMDREWIQLEDKYKITRRYGQRVLPPSKRWSLLTTISGIVGICAVVIGGILATTGDVYFVAFGVIMIAILIAAGIAESSFRDSYEKAKTQYEKQRTEHLQRKPK